MGRRVIKPRRYLRQQALINHLTLLTNLLHVQRRKRMLLTKQTLQTLSQGGEVVVVQSKRDIRVKRILDNVEDSRTTTTNHTNMIITTNVNIPIGNQRPHENTQTIPTTLPNTMKIFRKVKMFQVKNETSEAREIVVAKGTTEITTSKIVIKVVPEIINEVEIR